MMADGEKNRLAPRDSCTGCGACASGCPRDAIRMETDLEGFSYPQIMANCVECGHCSHVCPILRRRERRNPPAVFAVWNEDDAQRRDATAGGVFAALGRYMLECGGVVYGAILDERLRVRHTAARNVAELQQLCGSKPVQSELGDTFRRIRRDLDQGRQVLFSGTPCQVDGLYHYLGEHPDNLLTCDVLCHGVCSPGVWGKLLDSMAYIKRHRPADVRFSAKPADGRERRFRVQFEGGSTLDLPRDKSEFGRGLLRGLFLRPACHSCPYATTDRPGDLSMGVFAGLPADFCPEEQKKGVSLLLINTAKGAHIFDVLPLHRVKRTLDEAVAGNAALRGPKERPEQRYAFFEALERQSFQQVSAKFLSAVNRRESAAVERLRTLIKEKSWKKH